MSFTGDGTDLPDPVRLLRSTATPFFPISLRTPPASSCFFPMARRTPPASSSFSATSDLNPRSTPFYPQSFTSQDNPGPFELRYISPPAPSQPALLVPKSTPLYPPSLTNPGPFQLRYISPPAPSQPALTSTTTPFSLQALINQEHPEYISPPAPSLCSATSNLTSESGRHPQILLDQNCSIGHHQNATSAEFVNDQGLLVNISFNIRDPPALARCFVSSHDLTGRCCLSREPYIIGTAGGFLLLNIQFCGNDADFFVYRAGPGFPSIHHVPRAPPQYPTDFELNMAAILPLPDDNIHFAVVFPTAEHFLVENRNHYTLHIYQSDSKVWSKKVALLSEDNETQNAKIKLLYFNTTSVVHAGLGLIGWIDLWWGILLCNVLDDKPIIRFVPLPVPELWKTQCQFSSEFEDLNPRPQRHMAVNNGVIKFIELKSHTDQGWMATQWSRAIASDVWHKHMTVGTSNIAIDESSLFNVLPEMLDGKKLAWQKIVCGGPTLSLLDDIFYVMAKVDVCHPSAFVLAVNTQKMTLESSAECCAKRMFGFEPTYVPCLLSSYFSTTAELIEEQKTKAIATRSLLQVQPQS